MRNSRQGDVVRVATAPCDQTQVLMASHWLPDTKFHCRSHALKGIVGVTSRLRQLCE